MSKRKDVTKELLPHNQAVLVKNLPKHAFASPPAHVHQLIDSLPQNYYLIIKDSVSTRKRNDPGKISHHKRW